MIDSAERAAELYHAGVSPWIVVSGFANPYHRATETEATLLGRQLQRLAVPNSAILFEHQAAHTGENITRSARLLAEMMIQSKDIILVHKPYMTRRFLATAEAQWPYPRPRLYVTSQPTTLEAYYRLYEATYGSAAMMLVVGMSVFHFNMRGDWLLAVPFITLAALLMVGFGLLIGGWAKNENQSAPLGNLVAFPMMFLSGTFFPSFMFPEWLRTLSQFIPMTPVTDGLRLIMTEHASLGEVLPYAGAISLWMLVVYVAAIKLFRWE